MKKPVVTIIKVLILFAMIAIYGVWSAAYDPIFTNEMAMQQMTNDYASSSGIALYSYIRNYAWIALVLFAILLFAKDVVQLINNATKKNVQNKEDEEHEKH